MSRFATLLDIFVILALTVGSAQAAAVKDRTYPVGQLPATDSVIKVKVGQKAPDFTLPAVSGEKIRLSNFKGKKNVVLSFIPAAWTPVCSDQWPGYNIARELFEAENAVLLGISVDNTPTLYAWTKGMGDFWFPVLSDFWPHGFVAAKYGILRSSGVSERAIFIIDKQGIIRFIEVHDINTRPDLGLIMEELRRLR